MPTVWPRSPGLTDGLGRLGLKGLYAVSRSAEEHADLAHHLETIAQTVEVLSIDSVSEGALSGALPRLRELDLREPSARLPVAPQLERLTVRSTKLVSVAAALPCLRALSCIGDVSADAWPLLTPPTLRELSCYTLPTTLQHATLQHLVALTLTEVNDSLLAWLADQARLEAIQVLELPEELSEQWSCRLLARFGQTLINLSGPWLGRQGFELLMAGGAPMLAAMTFCDLSEKDFGRLRTSGLSQRLTTLRWIGELGDDSLQALLDPLAFPVLEHLWLEGVYERPPEGLAARLVHRFGHDVFL
jgi:hypothetical protein